MRHLILFLLTLLSQQSKGTSPQGTFMEQSSHSIFIVPEELNRNLQNSTLTLSPTANPTQLPTFAPTSSPTLSPSLSPSISPTTNPTANPTLSPSSSPTNSPTVSPTTNPTANPSLSPTTSPTGEPTPAPSINPTTSPTSNPTANPTTSPTNNPTGNPTQSPSLNPTSSPTANPTSNPTTAPTQNPTVNPTKNPTQNPTVSPTKNPTQNPTTSPTNSPTKSPTVDTFVFRNKNYIRLIYVPIILLMCSFTILCMILKRKRWKEEENVIILKKEIKKPVQKKRDSSVTEEVNEDDIELNMLELSGSSSHKERRILPSKQASLLRSNRIKVPKLPKVNLRSIKVPSLPKLRRPNSDIAIVRSDDLPLSARRRPSGLFVRMSQKRGGPGFDFNKERNDSFTSQHRNRSIFGRFSFMRNDRGGSIVMPNDPRRTITFDNESMRKGRSSRTFDNVVDESDSTFNSKSNNQLDPDDF